MSESKLSRTVRDFLAAEDGPAKDRAREAVYAAHEFLVTLAYARWIGMPPKGVDPEELLQLGRIRLFECIDTYSADNRAEFVTYAIVGIRNAMTRGIKGLSWSRSARIKEWDIKRVKRQLENCLGRPATNEEIAERFGISVEKFMRVLREVEHNYPVYIESTLAYSAQRDSPAIPLLNRMVHDYSVELHAERREAARQIIAHGERILRGIDLTVFRLILEQSSPREISERLGMDLGEVNNIMRKVRYNVRVALADSRMIYLYDEWTQFPRRKRKHRRRQKNQELLAA